MLWLPSIDCLRCVHNGVAAKVWWCDEEACFLALVDGDRIPSLHDTEYDARKSAESRILVMQEDGDVQKGTGTCNSVSFCGVRSNGRDR